MIYKLLDCGVQSYKRCLVHCFGRARSAPRQAPVLGRVKAQEDAVGLAQSLGKNARFVPQQSLMPRFAQNGEKSLMVHGQCAMRLHIKTSPAAEVKEIEDLAEVRSILQECGPFEGH
jgi:hypothetical protein